MSHLIAITDYHGQDLAIERKEIESAGCRLEHLPGEADLLSRAGEIAALGVRHFRVEEPLLRRLPNCRVVVRYGVGYDNIDVAAATARGIVVAYVPDYCTEEVAEQALAGAMLHIRRLAWFEQEVQRGNWDAQAHLAECSHAVELVVVGLGRIGSALARKAVGVGFRVAAYDPLVSEEVFPMQGIQRFPFLAAALAEADILSLHVPLTRAPIPYPTSGMIGAEELAKMKAGAMLINTARGAVVDNLALCEALESGHLGGALLDVLEDEPRQGTHIAEGDFPIFDRLSRLPGVVLTPHCSFNSRQAVLRVKEMGTQEMCRVLKGGWPRDVAWVNPEVEEKHRQRFGGHG